MASTSLVNVRVVVTGFRVHGEVSTAEVAAYAQGEQLALMEQDVELDGPGRVVRRHYLAITEDAFHRLRQVAK